MKFTADDYRRGYAAMDDLELLSLRRDELSDIARQCYDVEIARRGIDAPPPEVSIPHADQVEESEALPAEPEPGTGEDADEREEEELAPAGIFRKRGDAHAARERLQSAFIPTFLENDGLAGEWTPRSASGSFRLLVPASYLAQARDILSAPQ